MLLGAKCDGHEDCANDGVCCGTLDDAGFTYRSIECASRCDGAAQYALCHSDEDCGGDGLVCRRSQLLPFEFLRVCAPPLGIPVEASDEALADVVLCGTERCTASGEQCCLGVVSDTNPLAGTAREPYCAPRGEPCECAGPRVIADAGPTDGGQEASLADASRDAAPSIDGRAKAPDASSVDPDAALATDASPRDATMTDGAPEASAPDGA